MQCKDSSESQQILHKPGVQLSTLHLLVLDLLYVKYSYWKIMKTRFIISCICGPPKIMVCEYGMINRNHCFKENIKEILWEVIGYKHNCKGCIQTYKFFPVSFANSIPLRNQYCNMVLLLTTKNYIRNIGRKKINM